MIPTHNKVELVFHYDTIHLHMRQTNISPLLPLVDRQIINAHSIQPLPYHLELRPRKYSWKFSALLRQVRSDYPIWYLSGFRDVTSMSDTLALKTAGSCRPEYFSCVMSWYCGCWSDQMRIAGRLVRATYDRFLKTSCLFASSFSLLEPLRRPIIFGKALRPRSL